MKIISYNHVLSTLDCLIDFTYPQVILTSSNQEPTVWSPETRNGEVPCLGPLVHFAFTQKWTMAFQSFQSLPRASCGKLFEERTWLRTSNHRLLLHNRWMHNPWLKKWSEPKFQTNQPIKENMRKPNLDEIFPQDQGQNKQSLKTAKQTLVSPLLAAAQRSKPPTTFHGILVDS